MSIIKNQEDIEKLKKSALVLRSALFQVEKNIRPGISAAKLDLIVETFIRDHGGRPSFKGLYGFPNTLITELNEEVVHGLSNPEKIIPEKCVVSFDCGVEYQGLFSDMCILLSFGNISEDEKKLIEKTKESLWAGIAEVKAGKKTGDIGFAVNKVLKDAGLGNVLELGGHGLGYQAHCEPHITHKGKRGKGKRLFENQVIALEPMVTLGSGEVDFIRDPKTGWEVVVSKERVTSAHVEHTLLVTKNGCEVITDILPENMLK
jgi:methionyl aminopeptidase